MDANGNARSSLPGARERHASPVAGARPVVAAGTHPGVPDLLAPAGGWPQLRAGVQAGADAVYLGVRELNARRGAANFAGPELDEVVRYAHLRGVRVYLALNVLVLDEELEAALAIAQTAAEAGVDALIVQDLGLARTLSERFRGWRMHASTQVGAHNSATVRWLATLGFARVTLARELALDEIAAMVKVAQAAGCEIETFAHGALCYSYSGQCLMSSFVGGRSANRGLCPQACRMPYDVVGRTGQAVRQKGAFPLSTRDLCGLPVLENLVGTGVAAVKIEGRMKSAEYVAATVAVYRRALDVLGGGPRPDRRVAELPAELGSLTAQTDWLADAFTRGFTGGLMVGSRGDDLMAYGRPSNRGVVVGRLEEAVDSSSLVMRSDRSVEVGDRLEIWTGRPSSRAGRAPAEVTALDSPKGDAGRPMAHVVLDRPIHGRPGDRVVRVSRAELVRWAERLARRGANERRVGVRMKVRARVGAPLSVEAASADGAVASVEGPILEPARTAPLGAEAIRQHLGRLGNTVYEVTRFEVDLEGDVGLGYGVLHRLKDEIAADLDAARLSASRPGVEASEAGPRPGPRQRRPLGRARPQAARAALDDCSPRIHVVVRDGSQLAAALEAGADLVSAPVAVALEAAERFGRHARPGRIAVKVPPISHDAELEKIEDVIKEWDGPVLVANVGALGLAHGPVTADWRLGVTNLRTAQVLASAGCTAVGASPELTIEQAGAIASESRASDGAGIEILCHGWIEVMTGEHCPARVLTDCAERCGDCPRHAGWSLVDSKGFRFPFTIDEAGRAHIYNGHELCLAHLVPDILSAGAASLRLDLELLDSADVGDVVRAYRHFADIAAGEPDRARDEADRWRRKRAGMTPLTTGHAFRGLA